MIEIASQEKGRQNWVLIGVRQNKIRYSATYLK